MNLACRWNLPKAVEMLLEDPLLNTRFPDDWFRLNFLGPDPDAAFDIFQMIYSRHSTMMYTLVLQSVEHGKDKIFDFLFDLQLRQDEQLGALAYASEAGSIHVCLSIDDIAELDEHLRAFLRGEDYNGREYTEYDFYNVLCWAMRDHKPEIAEYLCERVDVSHYGLQLALSGCMHGYFHLGTSLVEEIMHGSILTKMRFCRRVILNCFSTFNGIPGIYLDHLDRDLAAFCVSSRQVVDYLLSKGEIPISSCLRLSEPDL
ncbi:hypothetical protein EDD86DRAFT_248924 [Gorgonomyces haynaldii]|nr:hypothetical protein EDD86DRAFT_248924 [Gorgonomyces haynaldii]